MIEKHKPEDCLLCWANVEHEGQAIPFNWYRVVSDHPQIGEQVLIWDVQHGVVRAERQDDFFYEVTNEGYGPVLIPEPVWWLPVPSHPPGEKPIRRG